MRSRQPAVFVVVVAALAGAAAFRVLEQVIAYARGGQPVAVLFSAVFGAVAVASGFAGTLAALAENRVDNRALRLFALLYSVAFGTAAGTVVWQPLDFSIAAGGDTLRIGPCFLGLALLAWRARRWCGVASRWWLPWPPGRPGDSWRAPWRSGRGKASPIH